MCSRNRESRNEAREVIVLGVLSLAALFFLVGFLNATATPQGGSPDTGRLWSYGVLCPLFAGAFTGYAVKVYYRPRYGQRAWRALGSAFLVQLAVSLLFILEITRR